MRTSTTSPTPRARRSRQGAVLLALAAVLTGLLSVLGAGSSTAAPERAATSISTCKSHIASGGSALARRAATYACDLIGQYPYVFGAGHGSVPGPSQSGGLDCSSFVRMLYYMASGKDLLNWSDGNNTTAEHKHLTAVSKSNLEPGDLVFFDTEGETVSHVAMYLGGGYLIEEYDTGHVVQLNTLSSYGSEYHSAARVSGSTGTPSKWFVDTFSSASVYASPTSSSHNGTLGKGTNYVYCKEKGRAVTHGSATNYWWLKTDPDSGSDHWVSAYYLSKWGNNVAKDNAGNTIPTC